MKQNGFTFIEILLVLILVGTLTIIGLVGFKHARTSHQIDTLIQELTILRTAIVSYKEMHGKLPEIEESPLSSDNFNALKPFWYPFKPGNSKVAEGASWWGKTSPEDSETQLTLNLGEEACTFDADLLKKKLKKLCRVVECHVECHVDPGANFFILEPYEEEAHPAEP